MIDETLAEIENTLAALTESVATCPPELEAELQQRIAECLSAEAAKIDRVNAMLTTFDNVAANASAEIERLRLRKENAERAAEKLKGYIVHVLHGRDGRPLKGNLVTLSIRHTQAVTITDPNAIPAEFRRTTVNVDYPKQPIKDAIKAGQDVPGAALVENEHLVRK